MEVLTLSTVQVQKEVTAEDAERALSSALGPTYKVSVGNGSTVKVKRSSVTSATIKVSSSGGTTTFRVSGDGLIIFKIINSLGIASTVSKALDGAFSGQT